jgi:hypothetical protein
MLVILFIILFLISCYIMACCCENILDIGCFNPCGALKFESLAATTGEYTLEVEFLDTKQAIKATIDAGNQIEFNLDGLNENFDFTARLFAPDGTKLTITVGSIDYDCIKFKTVIGQSFNPIVQGIIA